MNTETIAAISTALSEGGIGIIRVSGDDAFVVVDNIFRDKNGDKKILLYKSHTIHYGFIYDGVKIVDEVMVSVMKAPNTFTRENVVEINCHGGILVTKTILKLVISNGARLAEPGEFTKRAFLNGRIDLSQAEAVMDLISSNSNSAMRNSINHLEGKLYNIIVNLRERTLYEIAFIESALDDPEHISLEGYTERLFETVTTLKNEVKKLYDTVDRGKYIKEGINTAIVGRPNVGKSSLLNTLSGFDRAIVTDIAGTTRDTIEQQIVLNDLTLNLIDTAGIRNTSDRIENIGVERSKKSIDNADLVLFVIDSSNIISEEDFEIYDMVKDKKLIILLNKCDLSMATDILSVENAFGKENRIIVISAKNNEGIDLLGDCVSSMFVDKTVSEHDELYITDMRQASELLNVINSFDLVLDSLNKDLPEDFYSIDLMNAYSSLGRIIGEDIDDDLVTEIFSKFCMGK